MMKKGLLNTKFYIPPYRSDVVARSHLVSRLNESMCPGTRAVLLSAPTGYGKTTLLVEWIAQLKLDSYPEDSDMPGIDDRHPDPVSVSWLTLDEDDNDVYRFLTYLVAAIQNEDPGFGQVTDTLLQTPAGGTLSYDVVVRSIINELADYPHRCFIILDDYYMVQNRDVHEIMIFLLNHLPENIRLVISTRSDPPLSLAKLRVRNQLIEMRQSDLRLSMDESFRYFNEIRQMGFDEKDIRLLDGRTEGWAAGLNLVALSLQGREDRADFIRDFSGSSRYLLEYLIEEVLTRQPEPVQRFLLASSILERMTAPLCDFMLDRNDSQMMLETFEVDNLFIIPLDLKREWYRYHHLFVEFLRSRLSQVDQVAAGKNDLDRQQLHHRASQWFEENDYLEEALKHALEAENYIRVAELIENHGIRSILTDESHFILKCLKQLPKDLLYARPRSLLNFAWYLFISGQHEAAEEMLDHIEESASHDEETILVEMDTLRTVLLVLNGDVSGTIETARLALERLSDENQSLRAMVLVNLGLAYDLRGDISSATQIYQDAFRISQQANVVVVNLLAAVQLADLKVLQGELCEAERLYLQALDIGTKNGRKLPISSMGLAGLGRLYYEWNELDKAAAYLQECIDIGGLWESADMRASGFIYLAFVLSARGEYEVVGKNIKMAEEAIQENLVSQPTANITRAYTARLWLKNGKPELAREWQSTYRPDTPVNAINLKQIEESTSVRIFIAQSRPDMAIRMLEKRVVEAEDKNMVSNLIEALVLLALALDMQGKTQQAVITLFRALSLGEGQGYCRIFLDEGRPMKSLLLKARSKDIQVDYINRLLALFPQDSPSPMNDMVYPGLSDREIDVLQLMADGLSNGEIAERLFISQSTIKTHINNIYNKLNTGSRIKAIRQARELGLIK